MALPAYRHNDSMHRVHHRRYKRRVRLAAVFLLALATLILVVAYKVYILKDQPAKTSVGASSVTTIAGPKTFKNAYFDFSDNSNWIYAANDSTNGKLTYLLYEAGVPAHSLTVYVNQTPLQGDLATTRVLPVNIVNGNTFSTTGDISPPCGSLYGPSDLKRIKTLSMGGTSFLCVPDSPQYTVVVGQVGGDYNLALRRANGQAANYIIIYHNLTVSPDPSAFIRIMKTFKAL